MENPEDPDVRSFELLGRFRVQHGPNANKFIAAVYAGWSAGTKLEYCKSNLRFPFPHPVLRYCKTFPTPNPYSMLAGVGPDLSG